MKKNILIILSYIVIAIIFFTIGILVSDIREENKSSDSNLKEQRVSISQIIISDNHEKTTYSESDMVVSKEIVNTYNEIINSKNIKSKVKKVYPEINNIKLTVYGNTSILVATYICDSYTDNECIEINKKYVSLFIDIIDDIYNVKTTFLTYPIISVKKVQD